MKHNPSIAARGAVSFAALAWALGSASAAGAQEQVWGAHVDTGVFGGEKSVGVGAEAFVPLAQDGRSLTFATVKADVDNDERNSGGVAIGWREMRGSGWNIGVNAGLDVLETGANNTFSQASFGAELVGRNWEFRGNVYVAIDRDEAEVARRTDVITQSLSSFMTFSTVSVDTDVQTSREVVSVETIVNDPILTVTTDVTTDTRFDVSVTDFNDTEVETSVSVSEATRDETSSVTETTVDVATSVDTVTDVDVDVDSTSSTDFAAVINGGVLQVQGDTTTDTTTTTTTTDTTTTTTDTTTTDTTTTTTDVFLDTTTTTTTDTYAVAGSTTQTDEVLVTTTTTTTQSDVQTDVITTTEETTTTTETTTTDVTTVEERSTTTTARTAIWLERALDGADVEVGYRLPFFPLEDDRQLRVYAGAYQFSAAGVDELQGVKARVEGRWYDAFGWSGSRLTVEGSWRGDDIRGENWAATARLRVPLQRASAPARKLSEQARRMTDPIVRERTVMTANLDAPRIEESRSVTTQSFSNTERSVDVAVSVASERFVDVQSSVASSFEVSEAVMEEIIDTVFETTVERTLIDSASDSVVTSQQIDQIVDVASVSDTVTDVNVDVSVDVDVTTASSVTTTFESAINASTGVVIGSVVTVDASGSLQDAVDDAGANGLVIVDGSGGEIINQRVSLLDGQTFIGGGSSLNVIGATSGAAVTFDAAGTTPLIREVTGTPTDGAILTLASNTYIEGIRVRGSGLFSPSFNNRAINGGDNVSNVTICGVEIANVAPRMISFGANASDIQVCNSSFIDYGADAIRFGDNASNISILENSFTRAPGGVSFAGDAISFDVGASNVAILDNTLVDAVDETSDFVRLRDGFNEVVISGNAVDGLLGSGVFIDNGGDGVFDPSANLTVTNNTFENYGSRGVQMGNIAGVTISNNVFDTGFDGLFINGGSNIAITDNTFRNLSDQGVEQGFTTIGGSFEISGNSFDTIGSEAIFFGTSVTAVISDNTFVGGIGVLNTRPILHFNGGDISGSNNDATGATAGAGLCFEMGAYTGSGASFVGGAVCGAAP